MQYCQSLDLLCGQAVCFLCLCNIRGILCSHHAYGNVEHICNTVLETADYEALQRLIEAEGYATTQDWLTATVRRYIAEAGEPE
mgnify:FL=1